MKKQFLQLRAWVKKYNKILMPLSLVFGFGVDYFTLNRPDRPFENTVFVAYLVLATLGIAVFFYLQDLKNRNNFTERVFILMPLFIQFIFGGLFSGFSVLYLRSGSIIFSWFFILILLVLMLGNEVFRKKYENFSLQITILFTGIFFYFIFAIPVVVNEIGASIFVLSGALALVTIFILIFVFYILLQDEVVKGKKYLMFSIPAVFIFVNFLYFTNIIPPIPLALKDSGVYHKVERVNGGYKAIAEIQNRVLNFRDKVHIVPGESVYVFSSVFAPAEIGTTIVHDWQYRTTDGWQSVSKITFPISGGRVEGFRGYSYKSYLQEGRWRVLVKTQRGQVVGHIPFEVVYTTSLPITQEINL